MQIQPQWNAILYSLDLHKLKNRTISIGKDVAKILTNITSRGQKCHRCMHTVWCRRIKV